MTGAETIIRAFHTGRHAHGEPIAALFTGAEMFGVTGNDGREHLVSSVRLNVETGRYGTWFSFADPAVGAPDSLIRFDDLFYGTTGPNCVNTCGGATVFSLNKKTHALTTLYAFPPGNVIQAASGRLTYAKGTLYGTMQTGGPEDPPGCDGHDEGCGQIFAIDPNTGAKTVLYAIRNPVEGLYIDGGVTCQHGKLYGTSQSGGGKGCGGFGCGTVFEVTP